MSALCKTCLIFVFYKRFQAANCSYFVFYVDIDKEKLYHKNEVRKLITFMPPLYLDDFSLLYIGRWGHGEGANVVEHLHSANYELTVITRGKGKVYTGNVATDVQKGDVYISFPFDIHKIESDEDDPLGYDFITFTANSFRFSHDLSKLWSDNISPNARLIHNENILKIIDNMLSELDIENHMSYTFNTNDIKIPFQTELLSAMCNQLIIYLLRSLGNESGSKENVTQGNSELCRKLMNYIDSHIYTIKNLNEIADTLGYNYSYLSALFRKTTTTSLSYYFKAKRLEISRLLLTENKLSISQIAEKMNYSGIYSFSKSFKEHYGISPRQYLKQMSETQRQENANEKDDL